jgi:hypothetical protein
VFRTIFGMSGWKISTHTYPSPGRSDSARVLCHAPTLGMFHSLFMSTKFEFDSKEAVVPTRSMTVLASPMDSSSNLLLVSENLTKNCLLSLC